MSLATWPKSNDSKYSTPGHTVTTLAHHKKIPLHENIHMKGATWTTRSGSLRGMELGACMTRGMRVISLVDIHAHVGIHALPDPHYIPASTMPYQPCIPMHDRTLNYDDILRVDY
jgi:hypothetical protein